MTKPVRIIAVPYDAGHRDVRMGRGPRHLLRNGLEGALADGADRVRIEIVEAQGPFHAEIATGFELFRLVSEKVRDAAGSGAFPLVLSGNCNATVGVIAGLAGANAGEELGIVWFDGHADFNTPETMTSGSLDSMGLAIAAGQGWANMMPGVPRFRPVREENAVLVGGRGASLVEKKRLRASNVGVVGEQHARQAGGREALANVLEAQRGRVRKVHVHLDLDVLDPEKVAPANEFAPKDGLTVEEVEEMLRAILDGFEVVSATMASYDPEHDRKDLVLQAGIGFARLLAG